jgi:hypothetical protein
MGVGASKWRGTRKAESAEVVNQIADFTVSQLQPVAFTRRRSGQSPHRDAYIGNFSYVETCEGIAGTAFD